MSFTKENPAAILTDTTRCTGCEKCVRACKKVNRLEKADPPRRWKAAIDDLSSTRFTTVVRRPGNHFVRRQCRHCEEPACASACIVGALQKQPEGPVTYDKAKCMGCRYCMVACPYGIPRYQWESSAPSVRKCDLCYSRIKDGKQSACTEECPEKATIFGSRDKLLAEARRRLSQNPKYVQKVFGETEVGGTSVIYISDIDLGFLGWKPDMGPAPVPERTWAALSKVPWVASGVGLGMLGIWWVIGRRMQLKAQQAPEAAPRLVAGAVESAETREKDGGK